MRLILKEEKKGIIMQSINLEEPLEVRNYIFQNYNTHRPYEQQELFEEAAHGHLEAVKEIEKFL